MQWPACYREAPFRANLSLHVITGGCTRNPHACHSPAPGVARCPALWLPPGPPSSAWNCRGTQTWSSEELLRHPQARDLDIPADVAYRRNMRYRAVPLAALLKGVHPEDHLQAVASDGFAAELPAAPLLAEQGSQAWLAIEDPQRPWPPLGAGKPSAGPFYLVWSKPEENASVRSNGPSRSSASAISPSGRTLPGPAAGRRRQRGSARRLRRVPEELPGLPPSQRCRRRPVRPGPEPAVQPHRVLPAAIPRPLHPRPAGAAAMATGENAGVPGTGDRRPGVAPADRLPAPHGRPQSGAAG